MGILVRGQLALDRVNAALTEGDVRLVGDIAVLREVAERRYREASATLRGFPEAVEAFRWDGGLVSRRNGRPSTSKALRGWLTTASRRLADRWGERVRIPRSGESYPVENPEHWGCWASCDGGLWAWREVVRMAEVLRLVERPTPPQYEPLPRLRSMGPNLAVYRSLGVPVLRPRPGHVFLAGRVCDLRFRCFTAVGMRRGYFPPGRSRLAGYFLRRGDPLAEIAGELFAAAAGRRALLPLADDATEEVTLDTYSCARQRAAEQFAELSRADAEEAGRWRRLARGLIDAALLGIPDARLEVFLRHEHQAGDVGGAVPSTEMLKVMAADVVYELDFCLTDTSADTVNARLGRSAQDEVHRRHESSHPGTFHERVRNRVSGDAGVSGLDLGPDPYPPDGPIPEVPLARGRRPDLFLIRGRTLGGRFTARGSQAVALQAEVIGSEDDVMLEVAFALTAAGYRLLAVAGEEFLVEVPDRGVDAVSGRVREVAATGARRWLGNLAAVSLGTCDGW